MITKNDEMISDFCGDRNIIFLQDRPHNFKLFCMLNPANVPYMVLVGFNGKCFYTMKSAPFEWARDLMIPAEEDAKIFKENLPYSIERKAASNWHEMLIGSLDYEPIGEEIILREFIDITGEYLASFINRYDKIVCDTRVCLTQKETWLEAVMQFLCIYNMLDGEGYDYVRPKNLTEIYNEGKNEGETEMIRRFRQEAMEAIQNEDVDNYDFFLRRIEEVKKGNYRKNMQEG